MATRSPGSMPDATKAAPKVRAASHSSAHESRVSPSAIASRSPNCAPAAFAAAGMLMRSDITASLERTGEGGDELPGSRRRRDALVPRLAHGHHPDRQVGDAGVGKGVQALL